MPRVFCQAFFEKSAREELCRFEASASDESLALASALPNGQWIFDARGWSAKKSDFVRQFRPAKSSFFWDLFL